MFLKYFQQRLKCFKLLQFDDGSKEAFGRIQGIRESVISICGAATDPGRLGGLHPYPSVAMIDDYTLPGDALQLHAGGLQAIPFPVFPHVDDYEPLCSLIIINMDVDLQVG